MNKLICTFAVLLLAASASAWPTAEAKEKEVHRVAKPKPQAAKNINAKPLAPCDLSPFEAGPLTVEGQPETDPNRVFLNETFKFEEGPSEVINGERKTSVVIREKLEIGFYRNWLAEGVSGLANQIHNSLPDSCTNSVGGTSNAITSYKPPAVALAQTLTRRACSSFDSPCGLPETTCTGGSPGRLPICSFPTCDWHGCHGGGCDSGELPQAPVCRTTTKMCRNEQRIDLFSATIHVGFNLQLGLSGEPSLQSLQITKNLTRNDVDSSQGELTKLLEDVGLLSIFNISSSQFENGAKDFLNETLRATQLGATQFQIPSASFIYLPVIRKPEDVQWSTPTKAPPGAAPIGITIVRDMALPPDLTCHVVQCLRKSKAAGQLLVQSCSLDEPLPAPTPKRKKPRAPNPD